MSAMSMSSSRCEPARSDVVDVLLAVDVLTLLMCYPSASQNIEAPTPVEGDACYVLAPMSDGIEVGRDGRFRFAASIGSRLRLRVTALALRGEHAVLMVRILLPQDVKTLTAPSLVVDTDVKIAVPQSADPEHPVMRQAIDYYWWMDVLAYGRGECRIDMMVVGRDAVPMGCFRLPIAYEIVNGAA